MGILLLGIVLMSVVLAYVAWRGSRQAKYVLIQSRETEHYLREEIHHLENKLRHALKDPITNLLGWALFEEKVDQAIYESERYHFTMGVMFVDVDDFKLINGSFGREAGDTLLRDVALRLQGCVRQVDTISRFTKDTFVILLAQLTKPETAAIVAQRVLQSITMPFQIGERELSMTACIGIALYPNDGQDTASLLRMASDALQLAKKSDKQCYQFYQESMHAHSQRELMFFNSLSSGTLFHECFFYFQPIVDTSRQAFFCVEALLHWQHPALGLVGTEELLSHAEKRHQLNRLSEWVIENACKQFLAWRTAGFNPARLGVSLSLKQLESSQFICQLSHILQKVAFNPKWLLVELKENLSEVSFDILEKSFNMLHYLGVGMAVDHFGSGSFALRHLKSASVHYVKLDRSFIDDIVENEQSRALVKSVCDLVQSMSMQLIVQGIENEQQMTVLNALGCTLMQGSFLGEALSNDEVTKILEENVHATIT